MSTPCFNHYFYKGKQLFRPCMLPLATKPFQGINFKKEFAAKETNSFPARVDPHWQKWKWQNYFSRKYFYSWLTQHPKNIEKQKQKDLSAYRIAHLKKLCPSHKKNLVVKLKRQCQCSHPCQSQRENNNSLYFNSYRWAKNWITHPYSDFYLLNF